MVLYALFIAFTSVAKKHGNSHWTDSPGNGSDEGAELLHLCKSHISDNFLFLRIVLGHFVNPDIDHHSAFFYAVGADVFSLAYSYYQDICQAANADGGSDSAGRRSW